MMWFLVVAVMLYVMIRAARLSLGVRDAQREIIEGLSDANRAIRAAEDRADEAERLYRRLVQEFEDGDSSSGGGLVHLRGGSDE